MTELLIEIFKWIFKDHPTLLAILVLLFRQNSIKRIINRQLPRQFRDNLESDVAEMKQDIREVKYDIKLLKTHGGVTGEWSNTQQNGQETTRTLSYKRFFLLLRKGLPHQRRVSRMKAYLKKLGKTKFQAFLFGTFVNMCLLLGYLLDLQDIQAKVDAWTPLANMVIQLILIIVYQWVEGSIDKASLQKTGQEYTTGGSPDAKYPADTESAV